MGKLLVTIVGNIVDEVNAIISSLPINEVNTINSGRLGNFKTLTYEIDILEEHIIEVRRELAGSNDHLLGMYAHGDWMHIYIFSRRAFL